MLLVLWMLWGKAPAGLRPERLPRFLRILLTFILVHIGWLMFRENSVSHLWHHFTLNPFAADATQWRMGAFFVASTFIYAFPLYLHPLVDRWLSSQGDAAAEHFPGWRWTLVCTATAAVLFLAMPFAAVAAWMAAAGDWK